MLRVYNSTGRTWSLGEKWNREVWENGGRLGKRCPISKEFYFLTSIMRDLILPNENLISFSFLYTVLDSPVISTY